ncbi:MAG: efflux RND transporter periplasmic adaptor subunit [Candidatus Aureabacteria bacterium]|nr:efflux RND transporter periplasmic adaptor subunit [Candidatus Auribacterota bacterium]
MKLLSKRSIVALAIIIIIATVAVARFVRRENADELVTEVQPARGAIRAVISTTGDVAPQNRLELKPPIGGRVDEILVREGDKVKVGQTLAWLSSTDRAALLDAARSQGPEAVKYWSDVYKPTPLISPIDGDVIVRAVEPGQTVTATTPVLVLSDRLIVNAQVDETDVGRVKVGQQAVVSLDAYPDVKVPARVDHISYESKVVNNVTIYEVDILPKEVPDVFRSGMSALVEIVETSKDNVLCVPLEAVRRTKSGGVVLLSRGNGKRPVDHKVVLGVSDDKNVEIVSGLTADDRVVISSVKKKVSKGASAGRNPLMPARH